MRTGCSAELDSGKAIPRSEASPRSEEMILLMARPPADGLRAKAADKAALFDHLVGAGEQCRGHFEAEHLCRAKIDRETRQVLGANLNRSESTELERVARWLAGSRNRRPS